jgi:hypothetical protein
MIVFQNISSSRFLFDEALSLRRDNRWTMERERKAADNQTERRGAEVRKSGVEAGLRQSAKTA